MHSTPNQLRDFIAGNVWKDMKEELDIWVDDVRGALEDPDGTVEPAVLGNLRGIIKACQNFHLMPEVLLENLLDDKEHDERDRIEAEAEEAKPKKHWR